MESQIISENSTITSVSGRTSSYIKIFEKLKSIKPLSILSMLSLSTGGVRERASAFSNNVLNNLRNRNKNFILPVAFIIIVVLILGVFLYFGRSGSGIIANIDNKPAPSVAKVTRTIDKEFEFPIRDDKGTVVNVLKYKIESAQLYDSIIVKGQRARAVRGRTFLVLSLKLSNQHTQAIEIKTADYVRLSVNNKNEFLAPDIHSDPVAVQPISTKYTRIGFAINETDKNLKIRVGEITGKKEEISIKF